MAGSSANHGFGGLKPSPAGKPCQAMPKFRDWRGRSSGFCGCAAPPRQDGRKQRRKTSRPIQTKHTYRNVSFCQKTYAACRLNQFPSSPGDPPGQGSRCRNFRAVSTLGLLAIGDLTFTLGPQPLNLPLKCDCGQQCPCRRAEEENAEPNPSIHDGPPPHSRIESTPNRRQQSQEFSRCYEIRT